MHPIYARRRTKVQWIKCIRQQVVLIGNNDITNRCGYADEKSYLLEMRLIFTIADNRPNNLF